MDNAVITTVINGEEHGMEVPSGLTIVDDIMFVTDNKTGIIFAFDMEGTLLDSYDTGLGEGALMGIYAASVDDLWFVDAVGDAVYRLQPEDADPLQMPDHSEYNVW